VIKGNERKTEGKKKERKKERKPDIHVIYTNLKLYH